MSREPRRDLHEELYHRILAEGGFVDRSKGQFRVDATAWGILALEASGVGQDMLAAHRTRLIKEQNADGRVCLSPEHCEAYWPTALAILAWATSAQYDDPRHRAVQFLLSTSGVHYPRRGDAPWIHDTNLRGWSWTEHTDPWIAPTAMCVSALRAAGHKEHPRIQEAYAMMLDRQLPHGGWNAGNTLVFGKELHPNPECTGVALTALAGGVDRSRVVKSIQYLQGEVERLRTPIDLGWVLLGLAAWGEWPRQSNELVAQCVANQSRYGEYDTSSLGLLYVGALAGGSPRVTSALLPQ
jgi:hypothetical protein